MAFEKLNKILIEKNFLDSGFLKLVRENDYVSLNDLEPFSYFIISELPEHISTQGRLNDYIGKLKEKNYLKKKNYFEFKEGKFISS